MRAFADAHRVATLDPFLREDDMADIFISYRREDHEEHGRVRPIAEPLRGEP